MPKHNILYLHETALISGAENSLLNLINKIDRDKFNPIFACSGEGPLADKLTKMGVKVCPVDFPQIRRFFGVLPVVRQLRRVISENNINLLHSNSIRTHIYAVIVGKLAGLPVIWHQRNLIMGELIDPDRLLSFFPDKIICNSYSVARRFSIRGNILDKVQVVFNGVDTETFRSQSNANKLREEFGIKPEEFVIGIASRFNLNKGHEIFLQAAKIILFGMPGGRKDLKFMVVGGAVFDQDKSREKYLRDMADTLGIKDKVVFTGFRQDMPEVYASMDVFVLASFAEACGRVVLEAMSSGKPVIVTNSGGNPEMVKDEVNGLLFEPGNARALADKILLLANNPMLVNKMGEAGRKMAEENFGIEKNVAQTQKIYLELIRK